MAWTIKYCEDAQVIHQNNAALDAYLTDVFSDQKADEDGETSDDVLHAMRIAADLDVVVAELSSASIGERFRYSGEKLTPDSDVSVIRRVVERATAFVIQWRDAEQIVTILSIGPEPDKPAKRKAFAAARDVFIDVAGR